MVGLVKFLVFSGLLIVVLVFLVVPVLAGPIASALISSSLGGGSVQAEVHGEALGLVGGRAREVRLRGRDVATAGITIGNMDVKLGDVSLVDRSFRTVEGELRDVDLRGSGGSATVSTISLSGPAERASASGRVTAAEAERLIGTALSGAGVRASDVRLGDGTVRMRTGGREVEGKLRVEGGALAFDSNGVTIPLLDASQTGPLDLDDVAVDPDGLVINGTVDARALAGQLPTAP